MQDIWFHSAVELAHKLRAREFSARELTQTLIDRIDGDKQINAVVVRDFERALADADRADARLSRGDPIGPLHGLPVTVKESFDIQGLLTTWGMPFVEHRAKTDAGYVQRLRNAGAVILGKTNVPPMLAEFATENPRYGRTSNPWDLSRTPGGSSGGSAAAVAAGHSTLGAGSDLGGSIRNPAHYCGVYGHKPTWGVVSPRGQAPPSVPRASATAPDLVVVGPLARDAADLAAAMGIVAGADELSVDGWKLELPPKRHASLKDYRVAVWPDDPISSVQTEIADRVQVLADHLAAAGATVSDTARPEIDPAVSRRTYVALTNAFVGAGVSDAMYAQNRERAASFDPDDTSREATIARTMVLDHRAWLRHHGARTRLRLAWREFFEQWDILLCPIMATTAQPHDERPAFERTIVVNGQEQPAFHQVFWASLASVAYLPGTVFPTGLSKEGLPIGLQAIGPAFGDYTTIEFARLVAEVQGGYTPPPNLGG